jgi:hypothetical protein
MRSNPVVFTVLIGLISIGILSLIGSFALIFVGKEVPEGLGVGVVAGVVGALSAILSRTGHDAPSGTTADPVVTTVNQPASDPIPVVSEPKE